MSDHCFKRTGRNAIHTPPATAHIQKWAFIPVKAAEGVPAADFASQTFSAGLAQVIVHFEHDTAGTFTHHITKYCSYKNPFLLLLYLSRGDVDI